MSLPPSTPQRLGDPVDLARPVANPASITRPPVVGNIDQLAIPQQAGASTISPTVYTRDLNVPGTNIGVETPRRMPGDVGDQFYQPVAGDPLGQPFTRDGRPLRNAGIGDPIDSPGGAPRPNRGPAPVNAPSPGATVSAPQSANPGRPVNPRTPWASGAPPRGLEAGSIAAGGALSGYGEYVRSSADGGGRLENLGAGVVGFGGAAVGTYYGIQAGAGAGVATANPVIGGTVAIGASVAGQKIGGRIGARAGRDIGRVADNVVGRFFPGWNDQREQYPNQTDPTALGGGEQIEAPRPAQPGEPGSVDGAIYNLLWSAEAYPSYIRPPETTYGPILGPVSTRTGTDYHSNGNPSLEWKEFIGADGAVFRVGITTWFFDGTVQGRNGSGGLERADGGFDPEPQPESPGVYAPNPARTAPQGNPDRPWDSPDRLAPPAVPFAPLPSEDNPLPWPLVAPLNLDLPGLTPEPDYPANFEPAPSPSGVPSAEPAPSPIPAGKPNLSPDAAPGSNPGADLGTDPDTPPQPTPLGGELTDAPAGGGLPRTYELPDGTTVTDNEDGSRTIVWPEGTTPPVMVPVPVPVGGKQPVTTPAWNLTNQPNERPTPYIRTETPPVRQSTPSVSNNPTGVCRYEQQRVADIQRKATDTQERAANPTSGFLGLYGLQIEARTKLGQTYDNTERIKERIRPEDFPITVPAQIANPATGMRTIESLGELGVWIVEQLDGVVGKWPMEVPVPGVNTALAVPNISEAIAEMFGMMISQQVTAAQILNTSSRTLAQAGSATQQAALANMIAKGNAEFLGYESRPTAVDMPLTYSPGKDPGEGLLEESTAKIKGWENTDGTDLKQILSDVLHVCQIIKAVYWRRLDAKGDFQAQIDEQIRGKSQWLDELGQRPTAQQASDWEQYLQDIRDGFSARTGDATPYGRNPDEGPSIRDVTPDPPPPTP